MFRACFTRVALMIAVLMVAALLLATLNLATCSLHAQVVASAKISTLPFGFGGGVTGYDAAYGGQVKMLGATAWASYKIYRGLNMQAEVASISLHKPANDPTLREQTMLIGGLYRFGYRFHGFRPFVKFSGGMGGINFTTGNPLYTHDTFKVYAASGGLERQLTNSVWLRAEYSYQDWQRANIHPNGVTLGATYFIHSLRRHNTF